jgi:hypothetical protein
MKDLELAPIGWQLFILGSYQSDSTAFPLFLDTYATRLLARPLRVFRSQPGFIRYRLMVADPTTTIAVAEWESEELGKPGAQRYREWLRSSGIAEKLSLETYDGPIVVAS